MEKQILTKLYLDKRGDSKSVQSDAEKKVIE